MNISKSPLAYHALCKPVGAVCNLRCKYCFYLSKMNLYPDSDFFMQEETLEEYIRQYINSQDTLDINIAWQGGEPTLIGLDFFKKMTEYVNKYKKKEHRITYALQTNGTKLDGNWCRFFKQYRFLIGLSIDGPAEYHDTYRVDKENNATFNQVLSAAKLLQEYKVDFNTLTTVHSANADHPLEVYKFLRDKLGSKYMQFIPIVERVNETGFQEGNTVTERSVKGKQYGEFLSTIFDEWVRNDVGDVFVQLFDVTLSAWYGAPPSLCIFAPTCGRCVAVEHNGDTYACDHYVEPKYFLGNLMEKPLRDMLQSKEQIKFGQDKLNKLTAYCKKCNVRFICNGECPKNRFIKSPDGEYGLNYLCEGYKKFFTHSAEPMRMIADMLHKKQDPTEIMAILKQNESTA